MRAFGRIYDFIYAGFAFGPTLLVPLFGWAPEATGSYSAGLHGVAVSLASAAALLLTLGRYPELPRATR
ncbi:MAG: hypothetical protein RML32_09240 [Gammaproteobacteria bacterium]|nr:hypothetical protein [Gammaproteobacteria bacterium]